VLLTKFSQRPIIVRAPVNTNPRVNPCNKLGEQFIHFCFLELPKRLNQSCTFLKRSGLQVDLLKTTGLARISNVMELFWHWRDWKTV
jgi:hypothetical protein